MRKLLTAAAALALMASAAQAECYGDHNVTASSEKPQQGVAMSTYDGANAPVVLTDEEKTAEAAKPVCAEGDKDCAPAEE
jgi:hypothetical protein